MSWRSQRIAATAIAAVLALAGIATVAMPGAGSPPNGKLGAFAGYTWHGFVTSVHGRWTVPHITGGTDPAVAGTWIAAEAPGGGDNSPFIQVGTNEERRESDRYFAFWSDTDRHFHPLQLFHVAPGDVVSATLSHHRTQWSVEITDVTTAAKSRFTTSDEAAPDFNIAQWMQEDVTDAITDRPLPYPQLQSFRFSDLAVNHTPPDATALFPTLMSADGTTVAPGKVTGDSFAMRAVALTPVASRYILAIRAANNDLDALSEALANAAAPTVLATKMRSIAADLSVAIAALQSPGWPAGSQTVGTQLASALARQRVLLLQPPSTAHGLDRWFRRYRPTVVAEHAAAQAAEGPLGLPAGKA